MTFYWWSHWFWITLFINIHLFITSVHTYPNPEILLENNQNVKTTPNTITKLFQTTTLKWAASTTTIQSEPPSITLSTTADNPITSIFLATNSNSFTSSLPSDTMSDMKLISQANENNDNENSVPKTLENDDRMFEELPLLVDFEDADNGNNSQEDAEFKRSAEEFNIKNKTEPTVENKQKLLALPLEKDVEIKLNKTEKQSVLLTSVKLKQDKIIEHNNFTNFTMQASIDERNTSNVTITTTTTTTTTIPSISPTTTSPAILTNKTIEIAVKTISAAEWFNSTKPKNETNLQKNAKIDGGGGGGAINDRNNQSLSTTTSSDNVGDGSAIAAVTAIYQRAPFTLENVNKDDELHRAESEHRSRKSKVLSAEYRFNNRDINFSSETKNLLTRSAASTAPNDFDISNVVSGSGAGADDGNISSEALAIKRTYFLDAGAISAICFTVFGVCCTVGTIGIVLYRRRYLNKPQALSEPDSSVYIDDSTMRVSDNSDEMYSLDNDSFLNSLEAMTIQNYWTDTVKHTKL